MDIVTIDFETYYDRDYSLSKMTTESYIRDKRFQVIGMAVKVNDTPTRWYESDKVRGFLNSIDFSDKFILAHNTAFDGAILSWHYNIKPKFWLDTMSMARPKHGMTIGCSLNALSKCYKLGEKGTEVLNALGKRLGDFTSEELKQYAQYCINDVELTYKLWTKLSKNYPATELRVIDQTIKMYTEPEIEIDTDLLAHHAEKIRADKQKLVDTLTTKTSGSQLEKVLMSNPMFAKLLEKLGVEPPKKLSIRTGEPTFAFAKTDKEFTKLTEHPNLLVQQLVSARLGMKSTIEETRTDNLLKVAERGKLPIMLNYYGAHTGRFSGGDKLNLQNLPRNGAIRKALTVPKDKMLVACDSSQIEARMVAYISDQKDLVEAFRQGRDVYSEFASEIYGRKITKQDKLERFVGKTCILGLGYGMGAEKFKNTLALGQGGMSVDIDINEAQRIVNLYRQKNHKIVSFWSVCNYALRGILHNRSDSLRDDMLEFDSSGILLPNGLRIRYPMLRKSMDGFEYISNARTYRKLKTTGKIEDREWTKIYGGKVTENIVQALARIVISEQMVELGKKYKVLFQVHDELILITDAKKASETREHVETIMSTSPWWAQGLPVSCESGVGYNYGEAK